MADPTDIATEREELARNAALTQRKPEGPQATGRCLYCDEPLTHGRWCNAQHRDLWEKTCNR
jgi:hypothetical protein